MAVGGAAYLVAKAIKKSPRWSALPTWAWKRSTSSTSQDMPVTVAVDSRGHQRAQHRAEGVAGQDRQDPGHGRLINRPLRGPAPAAARVRARCVPGRRRARTRHALPRGGRAWPAGRRARWAAIGTASATARRRSVSTSSSPAAGPKAMPTATARLSSTTGDGDTCASASYSATMRGQSVSSARAGTGMAGGDGGLQRVGPERPAALRAQGLGTLQRQQAAADQQPVPAAAVLLHQQHRSALRIDARRGARGLQFHQRDQAVHLGLARRQFGQHAAQAQRLAGQRRAHPVAAARWRCSPR